MSNDSNSVAIRADLLEQARDLNIDATKVAERALYHRIREQRSEMERAEMERKFHDENAEAFAYANEYFEKNGFPFPQYRRY